MKPPIDAEMDRGLARLSTSKGKLVVWEEPAEDATLSLVLAGYESKPGTLMGEAKVVRRTSGRVGAVDAVVTTSGNDIAIAWASRLGEGNGGQLFAMAYASVDLAKIAPPITLGIVRASIQERAHVAVSANPKMGGVIAMHQGPPVKCIFMDHPEECLSFEVKAVSAAGKIDHLAGPTKLDGGPSPEFLAVDLDGRALGVYASSMRGGRTVESIVVPYVAGESVPTFDLPLCGGVAGVAPEVLRGTKGEYVALCINARPQRDACATPQRGNDSERCPTIAITNKDGNAQTPKSKDATILKVECATDGKTKLTTSAGDITLLGQSKVLSDFTKGPCVQ